MVDQNAREDMTSAIRSYMRDEISAFQFDEALEATWLSTKDKTVGFVRRELWCFYDDLKDHQIHVSKAGWDYFNRLLLLLESGREIEVETTETRRRWGPRQQAASIFLAILFAETLAGACLALFGGQCSLYILPVGFLTMMVAWYYMRRFDRPIPPPAMETALFPFPSVSSLMAARREAPGFTKLKYPPSIADRKVRGAFAQTVMGMLNIRASSVFAFTPVSLLLQMRPETESRIRTNVSAPRTPRAQ